MRRANRPQNIGQFVVLLGDHRLEEHFNREGSKEDLFLFIHNTTHSNMA